MVNAVGCEAQDCGSSDDENDEISCQLGLKNCQTSNLSFSRKGRMLFRTQQQRERAASSAPDPARTSKHRLQSHVLSSPEAETLVETLAPAQVQTGPDTRSSNGLEPADQQLDRLVQSPHAGTKQ